MFLSLFRRMLSKDMPWHTLRAYPSGKLDGVDRFHQPYDCGCAVCEAWVKWYQRPRVQDLLEFGLGYYPKQVLFLFNLCNTVQIGVPVVVYAGVQVTVEELPWGMTLSNTFTSDQITSGTVLRVEDAVVVVVLDGEERPVDFAGLRLFVTPEGKVFYVGDSISPKKAAQLLGIKKFKEVPL